MVNNIERVELIACREGTYTTYVFQNTETRQYIMCTRLPNWNAPDIMLGDTGYLSYNIVEAGEEYYDPDQDRVIKYHYTNIYFVSFIKESKTVNNSIII